MCKKWRIALVLAPRSKVPLLVMGDGADDGNENDEGFVSISADC